MHVYIPSIFITGVIIQMTEIQKQVTEGGIVTVCASLTGQLGRNIEVRLATSSGGTGEGNETHSMLPCSLIGLFQLQIQTLYQHR